MPPPDPLTVMVPVDKLQSGLVPEAVPVINEGGSDTVTVDAAALSHPLESLTLMV